MFASDDMAMKGIREMIAYDVSAEIRKKMKVRFIDLVRPNGFPFSVEQAFGIFHWLLDTGWDYRNHGYWGDTGPRELLGGRNEGGFGCVNVDHVVPIHSMADLRERFHYAILAATNDSAVVKWREDFGIAIGNEKVIHFPHYDRGRRTEHSDTYDSHIEKNIGMLFSAIRIKLNVSLNKFSPDAKWVKKIVVNVYSAKCGYFITPPRFRFVMRYGNESSNSAEWEYTLAETQNDEPFSDTLLRAVGRFDEIATKNSEKCV